MEHFVTILGYILAPVCSAISWIVATQKRNNNFLRDLQESVNLLSEENRKLMQEVISLRKENIALRTEVEILNRKLDGVKTITRKAKPDEND